MKSHQHARALVLMLMLVWVADPARSQECSTKATIERGRELEVRACLLRELRLKPQSSIVRDDYRDYVHSHPQVGYDLVMNWDRFTGASAAPGRPDAGQDLEKLAELGDQAIKSRDFKKAFESYSRIESEFRFLPEKTRKANLFFRFYILHSMGRALYGMGHFAAAITVYGWLPPVYPNYRQVLFEKSWAAFRAGRTDLALGAIASQRSSYFGKYLEPESYLVWIYVLRKLCRTDEIDVVQYLIESYQTDLVSGRYDHLDWSKSDPVSFSWATLLARAKERRQGSEAQTEQARIEKLLKSRFATEKKRLLEQLEKVSKFSSLALSAKSEAFPRTRKVGSYPALLKRGFEMWPVGDAEDWWDEVGGHRYIGDSLCGRK